jgi:hypothetical protein
MEARNQGALMALDFELLSPLIQLCPVSDKTVNETTNTDC